MLLIYTGNGKGKSSACIGQCIRALGHNERVAYAQMMKSSSKTGEQTTLARLLDEDFYIGGEGFFRNEDERPKHEAAAKQTLAWAFERLPDCFMIILDEALYALHANLLTQESLTQFLDSANEHTTHIVLSGRHLPEWLHERADLITSMEEIKHPWQQGIKASQGIEF